MTESFNPLGVSSEETSTFIKRQLESAYLFSELDGDTHAVIAEEGKLVSKRRGESISAIARDEECVYFIVQGIVKVEGTSRSGEVSFLSLQKERDTIGVMEAVAEEKLRPGTATAFTDCVLLRIDSGKFLQLMHDHPKFAIKVSRQLSHRLSHMMKAFAELTTKEVVARLKSALEFLCFSFGESRGDSVRIDLQITQNDLANLINSTRQTTNKYLKVMERQGIVELNVGLEGGLLVNLEKLQAFDPEAN